MMKAFGLLLAITAQQLFAQPGPALNAQSLFEQNCASCHGDRTALNKSNPEAVYRAMTSGSMRPQAASLNEAAKRAISEYLTGAKLNLAQFADARQMQNRCAGSSRLGDPGSGPAWNGWGVDSSNTRFQSDKTARLTAAQVPRLK